MRIVLAFLFLSVFMPLPAAALTIDVSNRHVDITTAYAGNHLVIFGMAGADDDVAVVVRGPSARLTVRRKEPVLGLWLNTRSMTFRDVPRFYASASTRALRDLLTVDLIRERQLGIDALLFDATDASGPDADINAPFLEALIRARQASGLFVSQPAGVTRPGEGLFRADIELPAYAPAGTYKVEAYAVSQGRIVNETSIDVTVAQKGIVAGTQRFVYTEGLWHGLLMIALAIAMGGAGYAVFRRE